MLDYENDYSKKRTFSLEELQKMTPGQKRKCGFDKWHYGDACRGSYDEDSNYCQYTIGRDC